jgi:hypothetical protein
VIRINSKFNFYGVRGAALERKLIPHQEGYIRAKILMLPLGGLHVKHAVQRGPSCHRNYGYVNRSHQLMLKVYNKKIYSKSCDNATTDVRGR